MKKINKKMFGVGVIILFFTISLIFSVRAQVVVEQEFFRVNSASTTPAGAKRAGDEALIHIINRSGKSYFAPNKTLTEFESFRNNVPNYVAVSVCGDGVCGEGETLVSCEDDCKSPQTKYVDYCLLPLVCKESYLTVRPAPIGMAVRVNYYISSIE